MLAAIPKNPSPQLREPQKWSKEFQDFLDLCLKKNPKERSTAKQLLQHSFILKGSSNQILQPLLKQCLPLILSRKSDDIKTETMTYDFVQQGMTVTINTKTMKAGFNPAAPLTRTDDNKLIFGVPLEVTYTPETTMLRPHITDQLIDYLQKKGLDQEKIFVLNKASSQSVNDLKNLFEEGRNVDLSNSKYTPFDVAALFQLYLLQLPDSLLSNTLYKKFLQAARLKDTEEKLNAVKPLVDTLQDPNKIVLQKFMGLLNALASYSSVNQVSSTQLARSLAPLFLSKETSNHETVIQHAALLTELLKVFIDHYRRIFA